MSYKVRWNLGGSGTTFYDLTTQDASTFTFTQSSLTTGEIYKFKVIATNFIGSSTESDILSVYASKIPLQPSTPQKVSADQDQITMSWTATDETSGSNIGFNGGSTILSYKLYVNSTGAYEEVFE